MRNEERITICWEDHFGPDRVYVQQPHCISCGCWAGCKDRETATDMLHKIGEITLSECRYDYKKGDVSFVSDGAFDGHLVLGDKIIYMHGIDEWYEGYDGRTVYQFFPQFNNKVSIH